MIFIDRLRAQLSNEEGLRLKPYLDSVGKWTIGYGRNLDDVGISKEEAAYLRDNDVYRVMKEASSFEWFKGLSENRKLVICKMLFNLGLQGFFEFKRLIAALEKGQFENASHEMLASKWAGQVGKRALHLAAAMRSG